MTKLSAQMIDPKAFGRRNIERPVFDANCVVRADQALKELSSSFQEWLETDIGKLQTARLAGEQYGWSDETFEPLLNAAHDIKGLGTTYEYPLVSKIAASLCKLIEAEAGRSIAAQTPNLMLAHVDAIRAAARDHIKSTENPSGRALLRILEAQVEALGLGDS